MVKWLIEIHLICIIGFLVITIIVTVQPTVLSKSIGHIQCQFNTLQSNIIYVIEESLV